MGEIAFSSVSPIDSDTSSSEEVQRSFKRNFTSNFLDFVLYALGMSFAAPNTVLVAFISELTQSTLAISVLSFVRAIGWLLPPLFSARYIERFKWRKKLVLLIASWEVLPWLFLSITVLVSPSMPMPLALTLFLTFYGVSSFAGGLALPAWLDIVGKVIPEGRRGFFLGSSTFCGGCLSVFGGILLGILLEDYPFPTNYSLVFLFAFISFAASLVAFSFTKEPPSHRVKQNTQFKAYVSDLLSILRADKDFLFFITANLFLCFQNMVIMFYTVFATRSFELTGTSIGILTSIFLGSNTVTNLLWGFIGDRWGHIQVARLGAVLSAFASLLAVFTGSSVLLYLLFTVAGIGTAAIMLSNTNLIFELSEEEHRPSYIAMANALQVPSMALASFVGGLVADLFGYSALFLLTSLLLFIGLLFLMMVKTRRPE